VGYAKLTICLLSVKYRRSPRSWLQVSDELTEEVVRAGSFRSFTFSSESLKIVVAAFDIQTARVLAHYFPWVGY